MCLVFAKDVFIFFLKGAPYLLVLDWPKIFYKTDNDVIQYFLRAPLSNSSISFGIITQ